MYFFRSWVTYDFSLMWGNFSPIYYYSMLFFIHGLLLTFTESVVAAISCILNFPPNPMNSLPWLIFACPHVHISEKCKLISQCWSEQIVSLSLCSKVMGSVAVQARCSWVFLSISTDHRCVLQYNIISKNDTEGTKCPWATWASAAMISANRKIVTKWHSQSALTSAQA